MRVGIVILPEDRWWAAEPKWRAAEEYGFDHAWTYDHLGWRSLVDGPWFSAMPTLSAAAMVTSRIRLGTFVASPNFRHPLPFMRELITVDDLADGRLVLGVGAGGLGYDTSVFGESELGNRARADRFAEFVAALDGLLMTDRYDYSGEYYTIRGARNLPGPVQRPRLPFLIAANGPRTMRVAARFGAGWVTTGRYTDDQDAWWASVAELARRFDEALEREGRGRAEVHRYVSLDAAPVFSLSSAEAFADAAGRAAELGFTDLVVHWPRSGTPYQGRESVLEQVVDEQLPALQGRAAPGDPEE
ncbi:alkanesulfonate monooxygenase SsuD/methylene tetrahydromethanopterin reductase-like flavin-dependent oxidoreductase (luciferase family) [Prauserella shujinwangii]|uniref:Alkanesulfonate monooxygenase SsuD/methylene tetrahydromethanopterin reductase-like flavin-dependent oxidoreductase (Luciferase family) n=1 Tax=Prauserella shujinwangii TaxID=1453103 RepID=A0A2T0LVP8_9PSEU|nr:LLM class flavin-dependent oxidoreductase [Prauserella shujinwangii]PRX47923.1 alkanesulfonate monooxygenase SsuD/methylene tetrahydromethanopterin reductase-like flavin-dependent oxidoreductase (luciferase family) [Prauserella shujinwangii]